MKVIKRDGREVDFDKMKIEQAILKAMKSSGFIKHKIASEIAEVEHEKYKNDNTVNISQIEKDIPIELISRKQKHTALAYEGYRSIREYQREINTIDESVLSLLGRDLKNEVMWDNSNKNGILNATQRDLIAGEVSKDLMNRKMLPPKISEAHKRGVLHYHDQDYGMQTGEFNCCLINTQDVLDNGTVMNGKLIESPKGFQTACTILTQIMAHVASNQYGGQSVNIKWLGKYLRKTYDKAYLHWGRKGKSEAECVEYAKDIQELELKSGVQTIQYQINTLMTTNGQSPFVTLFLHIEEEFEYENEVALIVQEILKQRILGIKNEKGMYITPAFPKLIYVLEEHNCLKGGKYDYITKLAIKCSAKRMYPDYISGKKMRENYDGEVFSAMGCRSFLANWKDESGKYKWEGRFNQGVVSLNLPQIGIIANGDNDVFWSLLDERLELCYEALMCRHNFLKGTPSDVSPTHWQHGVIARLDKGETIDKLLYDGYSTISLGYIGLYEVTKLMTGISHTGQKGAEFALKVMYKLREACDKWKTETGIGFGLYGTPAENLCYRFARIDKDQFGEIEDITDKGYYTNSYHVDVREHIDAFSKFTFESQFQSISTGGCISYVEIPNMRHNIEALEDIIKFIYENIQYAEFNTKSDYCHICGFDGEIIINDNLGWECPSCGNKEYDKMNVTRRTCGYLGENFWNIGKTKEINSRVLHV